MKRRSLIPLVAAVLGTLCCAPDQSGNPGGESPEQPAEEGVRIRVRMQDGSTRSALGIYKADIAPLTVHYDGKDYTVKRDGEGENYILVPAVAASAEATLRTFASGRWGSVTSSLVLPPVQFFGETAWALSDFPMLAVQTADTDGTPLLAFSDGWAVLDLVLSGTGGIAGIRLTDPSGKAVNGSGKIQAGVLGISTGPSFVVCNATADGNYTSLTDSGRHFPIAVAARNYDQGLDVSVSTGDHRVMRHRIPAFALKAGEVREVQLAFTPDDAFWFDGFDTLVWGGDYVSGASGVGYSPSGIRFTTTGGENLTGKEEARTEVAFDDPGSGYFQSNDWSIVKPATVADSHQMGEAYLKTRNLLDYKYLFRCQEYPGYVAVGTQSKVRGILQTPLNRNLKGIADIRIEFDFAPLAGLVDDLLVEVRDGGMIVGGTVDGVPVPSAPAYSGTASSLVIPRSMAEPAPAGQKQEWHHVELTVERATSSTSLFLAANQSTQMIHGFFVDNIAFTETAPVPKGSLRVLYWNIQQGMWADQEAHYAHFVEWVKRYDPDVCVWCEAKTHYQTHTNKKVAAADQVLPAGWGALAQRYGHPYTAIGGERDYFPQAITSKYPIETLLKITDTDVSGQPVTHGAALQKVKFPGRDLYFVTVHLVPSSGHENPDEYRAFEMDYILRQTVLSPAWSSVGDWILVGDLNSRSPEDDDHYSSGPGSIHYKAIGQILDRTDLKDVIAARYPGSFFSSTKSGSRIDYVFASPGLNDRVSNALIVIDDWAYPVTSSYVDSFSEPSDHRPVLVDFNL